MEKSKIYAVSESGSNVKKAIIKTGPSEMELVQQTLHDIKSKSKSASDDIHKVSQKADQNNTRQRIIDTKVKSMESELKLMRNEIEILKDTLRRFGSSI